MVEENGWRHLIGHADRMWKAEEQNAARLAARANLVLSGIAALIGLKVYAIGKEFDTVINAPVGSKLCSFWMCAILSLLCIGGALWFVLDIRRGARTKSSTASLKLELDPELVKYAMGNEPFPDAFAAEMVFSTTSEAAADLKDRNASRGKAVSRSQILLFLGAISLFASMVLYARLRSDEIRALNEAKAHEQSGQPKSSRTPDPSDLPPGSSPRGDDAFRYRPLQYRRAGT